MSPSWQNSLNLSLKAEDNGCPQAQVSLCGHEGKASLKDNWAADL